MSAKILIVEDDAFSRNLLVKLLSKEGFTVVTAKDGVEALEKLEKDRFQAVLTDWMMPNLDGIELIQKIRHLGQPEISILMITALASREAKERALEAGADDYIAKPIDNKDVVKRLNNCLKRQNMETARAFDDPFPAVQGRPPFFGIGIVGGTGAPSAIAKILSRFKLKDYAAFFIVFNGPSWMIDSFIYKLRQETDMRILLGEDGLQIKPGEVYVAPEDRHMVIDPQTLSIKIKDTPPENFVRPSADPLFKSLSNIFGEFAIAVVLTGMGNDGSIGSGYIAAADGYVIAQEPSTAVAPSMPKTIIDLRIATIIATIEDTSRVVSEHIRKIMHGK